MQTKIKDKDDIKIFILFLMRNIGYPLDFATINDMVLQDEFVDYFSFSDCFKELLDIGNIAFAGSNEEGDKLYEVTPRGATVADTLKSSLMGIIREKSLQSAMRLLSFKRRGAEIKCESEERSDGRYDLKCTILEHKEPVVTIDIVIDSARVLEKMKYNFKEKPEVVYRGILSLLSGDMNYIIS